MRRFVLPLVLVLSTSCTAMVQGILDEKQDQCMDDSDCHEVDSCVGHCAPTGPSPDPYGCTAEYGVPGSYCGDEVTPRVCELGGICMEAPSCESSADCDCRDSCERPDGFEASACIRGMDLRRPGEECTNALGASGRCTDGGLCRR